jgi:hypothetical protein
MSNMMLIFGLTFGFFGIIGLIEKIPFIDRLLEKGVSKIERR